MKPLGSISGVDLAEFTEIFDQEVCTFVSSYMSGEKEESGSKTYFKYMKKVDRKESTTLAHASFLIL